MGLCRIKMDKPKDSGPTRPINMVKIRISLEIGSKFGVTLAERPTVPKAEVASYRQSMYRMSGFRELITPASHQFPGTGLQRVRSGIFRHL